MRQRVVIAIALAMRPRLLIADEPTTALDVTIQQQIITLVRRLQADNGMAVVWITHDLGVVARVAERVFVMYAGHVVEEGEIGRIFGQPEHPYTEGLIASIPRPSGMERPPLRLIAGTPPDPSQLSRGCPFAPRCPQAIAACVEAMPEMTARGGSSARCWVPPSQWVISTDTEPFGGASGVSEDILRVEGLVKQYPLRGSDRVVHAVDDVSFSLGRGQTLGVVGESGCGKSTMARLLVRLEEPTAGGIWFDGREITTISGGELRAVHRRIQLVFQDPYGSLNPRRTIGKVLDEVLYVHRLAGDGTRRRARVCQLLAMVGLSPTHMTRYPHELSGGERQRVGIALCTAR